jgi:hypothetical protein
MIRTAALGIIIVYDVLSHSLAAGRQAAKLLKENFGTSLSFSLKDDNSLVTRVDSESQELL